VDKSIYGNTAHNVKSRKRQKTAAQLALLALRKKLGLTQQQLSVAMGVTSISICRWETSRPPTELSLLQLASFARTSGEREIAQIFQKAIEAENPMQYALGPLWPASAAERAFWEIHENRDIPSVRREYLKALRALERAHRLLIGQARAGMTVEIHRFLQKTHQELEWEIEDAEQEGKAEDAEKTKTEG
jgi:transcriptional regulator with XRE-family HTH domain